MKLNKKLLLALASSAFLVACGISDDGDDELDAEDILCAETDGKFNSNTILDEITLKLGDDYSFCYVTDGYIDAEAVGDIFELKQNHIDGSDSGKKVLKVAFTTIKTGYGEIIIDDTGKEKVIKFKVPN